MVETMQYYYFFLKSGPGNIFLQFSKEKKLAGFWIGYHELKLQDITYYQQDGKVARLLEMKDWRNPDFHLLCMMSSKEWREKVRVCTYDLFDLHIWKITGQLRNLRQTEKEVLGEAFNKTYKGKEHELEECHFLPAELVCSIPRSHLVAPIDSLSVFQYLNRGTFRPMFGLRPAVKVKGLDTVGDQLQPIEVECKGGKRSLEETSYGKFIRIYLNQLVEKECGNSQQTEQTLSAVKSADRIPFIASILNPAQVETLAYLLVSDLGITADVALGKGLDFVDVKGTWRHREEPQEISGSILEELPSMKVSLSEGLKTTINNSYVLPIQCKASTQKDVVNGILALKPVNQGERVPTDTLDIIQLIQYANSIPEKFPKVLDWIKLLEHDLFQ